SIPQPRRTDICFVPRASVRCCRAIRERFVYAPHLGFGVNAQSGHANRGSPHGVARSGLPVDWSARRVAPRRLRSACCLVPGSLAREGPLLLSTASLAIAEVRALAAYHRHIASAQPTRSHAPRSEHQVLARPKD